MAPVFEPWHSGTFDKREFSFSAEQCSPQRYSGCFVQMARRKGAVTSKRSQSATDGRGEDFPGWGHGGTGNGWTRCACVWTVLPGDWERKGIYIPGSAGEALSHWDWAGITHLPIHGIGVEPLFSMICCGHYARHSFSLGAQKEFSFTTRLAKVGWFFSSFPQWVRDLMEWAGRLVKT